MQVDVGPEENENVDAPPRRIVESSNLVIAIYDFVLSPYHILNIFMWLIYHVGLI